MIGGERHFSTGLLNTVAVSIIHKTTGVHKPLSCTGTWSVYDCEERTDPAPMNSLSPHLLSVVREFPNCHLLVGSFVLAYINANTEDFFPFFFFFFLSRLIFFQDLVSFLCY